MDTYITGDDGITRQEDFRCPVLVLDDPDASFARRCNAEVSLDTSGLTSGKAYLAVACERGHDLAWGIPSILRDMERDEEGVPLGV